MPVVQELVRRIDWSDFVPEKGNTLSEEIKCYSLPYGALGFVSHVLTYYAIVCLWAGRRPIWPFRKVRYSKIDLLIGIVAVALSVGLSIFSIVKCKNTWQLLVIAIWKMSMSLLNGITAIHAAYAVLKKDFDEKQYPDQTKSAKTGKAAWWVLLYIPGMFTGMVGLMSLVVKHINDGGVRKLTISFYCIVGGGIILLIIGIWRSITRKPNYKMIDGKIEKEEEDDDDTVLMWGFGGFLISMVLFSVLAAFYSDWALGMMTDNLVGLPSGDNSGLYWSYFVAKRLTMFSF